MSLNTLNSNFNNLPKKFSDELQNQWAVILEGEIIIHNKDFSVVFAEASNRGISKKAIFHKIPKKEIIIV